jgi:hypothetical protein
MNQEIFLVTRHGDNYHGEFAMVGAYNSSKLAEEVKDRCIREQVPCTSGDCGHMFTFLTECVEVKSEDT